MSGKGGREGGRGHGLSFSTLSDIPIALSWARKTVFMGFLQDTRLKVATVPFQKEPWNCRRCRSAPGTPLLARMVWGSISSTAVPSNAALPSWFNSASQFITGTKREPPWPARSRYYPAGLRHFMALEVSRVSPPPSPGEGSKRWMVPGRRLSGIGARTEVTAVTSKVSCFHEYIRPKGKEITQVQLSGEAQAHRFLGSWRQCAPYTLLLCIHVEKWEGKKKLTEGLGVIEGAIPPLPQAWSS